MATWSETVSRARATQRRRVSERGGDTSRIRSGSSGSSRTTRTDDLRELQKDLASSGTKLTSEEARAIAEGADSSTVRASIERRKEGFARSSAERVQREQAQEAINRGEIVVGENFYSRYEELEASGEIDRVRREERQRAIRDQSREVSGYDSLAGGYSTAASTMSGEGMGGVFLSSENVTSFEDPYVLDMRRLQREQQERRTSPTQLQRRAGRAAGSLRGFAATQYAEADPDTFFGGARIAAGDVAVALQDPLQRYAFGDKRLGREITLGYASGLGFGGVLGATSSFAGRAVASRSGSLLAGRLASGSINVAAGLAGAGYVGAQLYGASPTQVGRALPSISSGLVGGVQGFRQFSAPPLRASSVPRFLGIADATPPPRTTTIFSSRGLASSSQSASDAVVSVFGGRPVLGRQFTQTAFTGDVFVTTRAGSGFAGDVLTAQNTQFPLGRGTASISRSARGRGFIDLRSGRSGFVSPGEQQFSQVTVSASRGDGFEGQVGTTVRLRNNQAFLENFGQVISPTRQSTILTRTSVIEQTPRSFVQASRGGTSVENIFVARQMTGSSSRVSRGAAEGALRAFGLGRDGIPRSQVLNPRVTRLYADPTGGLLSSLSRPRAPLTRPSIGRGTPGGFGSPRTGFGFSRNFVVGGRGGFSSGLFGFGASSLLIPVTASTSVPRSINDVFVTPASRTVAIPGVRTSAIPGSDTLRVPDVGVGVVETTDVIQRPAQDFFTPVSPPPSQRTPPPPPPFVPALVPPLAALPGGARRGRGGRSQDFAYTSSLSALFGFGGSSSRAAARTGISVRRFL